VTTLEEVRPGLLVGRAIVELTFRIAYSRGEVIFFTNMKRVKNQWRSAKISEKHQVTIPIAEMRIAGLEAGERVIARADGPGRVVLEREEDILESFSGSLTGVFDHGILEQLRNEWD
jgi:bifunctional DNA-binding transcriptional regulator/antitoxin component of YhaV-PrlF toxin-antitoxin module